MWSFSLHCGYSPLADFIKPYLFGKTWTTSRSSRSKQGHKQKNIIKAINGESLFSLSGSREFQSLRTRNPVQYNQYVETDFTEGRRNII